MRRVIVSTTVAVAGPARTMRRNIVSVLEKITAEHDFVNFLVEVAPGLDHDTMSAARHTLDWARKQELRYRAAMAPSAYDAPTTEYVDEILATAKEVVRTSAVARQLESGDILILAWDDDDEDCIRNLVTATKRGAKVYDTEGSEIVLGTPDEEEEEVADEDDWPTVWVTTNQVEELQTILDNAKEQILSFIERQIKAGLESNTKIRAHK